MAVVDALLALSPAAWLWQWASTQGAVQQGWATLVMSAALAVLVALLIDKLWGEPPTWLHPVVGMGKLLDKLGKCIAPSRENAWHCKTFVAGSAAWCGLVAIFFSFYAA